MSGTRRRPGTSPQYSGGAPEADRFPPTAPYWLVAVRLGDYQSLLLLRRREPLLLFELLPTELLITGQIHENHGARTLHQRSPPQGQASQLPLYLHGTSLRAQSRRD